MLLLTRRGSARRLALVGAALAASAALAAPAQASLSLVGPTDPVTGFPAFYEDANGTQLTLCVADPRCPAAPTAAGLTGPDGEAFYQLASATVDAPGGGSVTADFNLEGAFAGAGDGQQITFGRVQVGMTKMDPNTTYTVTSPYGTGTWNTDANGNIAANARTAQRHEVGCGAAPCNFATAMGTEIGPFMQWNPAESAPPTGYIGDGVTPHTVVGPAVTTLTITGGSLPAGGISTDKFIVEGKLATPPAPLFAVAPGSGAFGSHQTGTTTTRTITVRNNGLAAMPVITGTSVAGADAASFALAANGCAGQALASGASCTVDIAFSPSTAGAKSATLTFTQAGGATNTVPLTGTGTAPAPVTAPAATVGTGAAAIVAQPTATAARPAVVASNAAASRVARISGLTLRHTLRRSAARKGLRVHLALASAGTIEVRLERLAGGRAKTIAKTVVIRSGEGVSTVRLPGSRLVAGRYRLVAVPVVAGRRANAAAVTSALRVTR